MSVITINCAKCDKEFFPRRMTQRFCSVSCRRRYQYQSKLRANRHEWTSTPRTTPYRASYEASHAKHKACPIELGLLGKLADNECRHGRLPGDKTPACGCWSLREEIAA